MSKNATPLGGRKRMLLLALSLITGSAANLPAQVADLATIPAGPSPQSTATSTLSPAAAGLGSLILLSLVQAEPIEALDEWTSAELSRDGGPSDAWLRRGGRELGANKATLALAASPLAFGLVVGNAGARSLGLHSLESLYAADFLAMVMKNVVGRARPNHSSDASYFKMFSSEADLHSFPSAHTTRVFALATVYSMELKDQAPWVPYVAYPIAAWTATTRVLDRAHWLTDVTAGALLGYSTARAVEWLNHRNSGPGDAVRLVLYPTADGGIAAGLNIPMR